MTKLVTIIHLLMQVASLVGFPYLALWSVRRGGRSRLALSAGLAMTVVIAVALTVATARFGNRLAALYGYGYTFPRVLVLYGLSFGLPILSATFVAIFTPGKQEIPWGMYLAVQLAAVMSWVVGVVVAAWLLPLFA